MRTCLVALTLLLTGAAHAGEHYECDDANGEITLAFDYRYSAAEPFSNVEMQLTGDFGLATDPAHPNQSGEFVSEHYRGEDFIGAELRVRDAVGTVDSLPVMQIRIVTVSEGAHMLLTGGVSVGGGGIWTVTCSSELRAD